MIQEPLRILRAALCAGASALALVGSPPALGQVETKKDLDVLRYGQEIADGAQVVSQSKDILLARETRGGETRLLFDTQNGAVTVERGGSTRVAALRSRLAGESRFSFDAATGRLAGNEPWIVGAANAVDRAAAGQAHLRIETRLGNLVASDDASPVQISLDRRYLTAKGVDLVLAEFEAPAFSYQTPDGVSVVHWARGVALTDRATGDIYAMATQHRATMVSASGEIIPLSVKTTLHGIRADGAWRMDLSGMPEVVAAFGRLDATAGNSVHETLNRPSAVVGPSQAVAIALAARIDAAAFLTLYAPDAPSALVLPVADSARTLAYQLPRGSTLGVTAAPTAAEIEAAVRYRQKPAGLAPYVGGAQLAQTIADVLPPLAFENPPGTTTPEPASEEAPLSGPHAPEPEPQQTPPIGDVSQKLVELQDFLRFQAALQKAIADQKRSGGNQGGGFPKDVQAKLEAMLGKQSSTNQFPADVLAKLDAILGKKPPNQTFPQDVLDKLDNLFGASGGSTFPLEVQAKLDELLASKPRGQTFPPEILAKLDALFAKSPKGGDFPPEVLEKLDKLLGRGAGARLVDGPTAQDPDMGDEFDGLLSALQDGLADIKEQLKAELLAGDWSSSQVKAIDDFFANNAFDYTSLVGLVSTDLSPWAEWLVGQNVRELERLALAAGYPNLPSALADANNIIRQSQDPGYRQWAMQAPSCSGLAGCGPSYLERWHMKTSLVALGDILNASRDIFSTGGFSDIGISGLNLSYLLRDHALEDGDIVRVRISQFGRTIYEGEISLTNLGQIFSLGLQRGVASLEIFAVNEGFSPPNTAQITVDNVVRGADTQTYSLTTGETATLRIEAGAKPGAPAASGATQ